MKVQNGKQRAFFAALFKSEATDVDACMCRSHAHPVAEKGLSDAHFDAVAGHLNDTLVEPGVPDEFVGQIMGAAAGLQDTFLNR